MSRVIPQRELRNQTAQILAAVEAGESFVVTRNGTPVAELRHSHAADVRSFRGRRSAPRQWPVGASTRRRSGAISTRPPINT